MNGSGPAVRGWFSTLAKLLPGVPLGLHWYNWHNSPFDVNYPEMFPAKPGIKEAAAWMKENGVFCMPYINGSLWEDEIASFTNAIQYTCKKPDGSCHTYKCGHNKNVLARMCPTTDLWKKTVAGNAMRLFDELDVKWEYKDVSEFKAPAVMSAVWLNDKGERRAFVVNISDTERRFEFKVAPAGEAHSVTLPPRSVMARIDGQWRVF